MKSRLIKKKLANSIYLVQCGSQYMLASTFLRVQEHYESKRFSGKIFSLEQYTDWYVSEYGQFSYFEDWSGFNVPSKAFRPFFKGRFDPLQEKEKRLLKLFRHVSEPFYVIGIVGSAPKHELDHEIAHALFHTDKSYRRAVLTEMRKFNTGALRRELADLGYARHVIPDEVQAYLIAPSGALGQAQGRLTLLRTRLRALFKQHARAVFR